MTIEKADDLKKLSNFLAELNKYKKSHIGFCGEKPEEIYQTLKEDFIDEDSDVKFLVAKNNTEEIVAAIGLDIDETTAEVWGPFNKTSSLSVQLELWEQLLNANPTVQTFEFFINKENSKQQMFMNKISAKKEDEHSSLEIKKQDFDEIRELKSTPFEQSDFQSFQRLHNTIFPGAYYDAKTIIERLGNGNILRLLKNESNQLQGYAYFEIDTEMQEASLEFIGISNEFKNKGLGTMMLKEVLSEMFSYPQIDEITLTVANAKAQANHIYIKAGFKPKDILINYVVNL